MIKRNTRYVILALMTALAISCGFLFPKININEDMTEYLPSDSRMREGLDTMKTAFPQINLNAYVVKAMFENVEDPDSLGRALTEVDGISGVLARSQKYRYTLYQMSVVEGANPKAAAEIIKTTYGDSVIVETNANSNMPDNMVPILLVGSALVFGILFLMCSSFVEALLFLIAIGLAVVINMGTNAFLPSVSMMTNTIVAVLQLVLSMDYSIILMNRYRQVQATEKDIDKAMGLAIRKASSSILSSSLTTIVGLLALVFMKFKIGMDLGIVLAKGVLCSLISIYTILPALILIFDRGIKATEKKVPLLKTDGIAAFEMKFRIPLAIGFVAVFVGACLLSNKTELSYASIWESKISNVFHPQNLFSVIYRTEDENKVIALADSLSQKDKVITVLSYPSLLKKEYTVKEMPGGIEELTALLPEKPAELADTNLLGERTLRMLYYAKAHQQRDERMSFSDIMSMAEDASAAGFLPEGMDIEKMIAKYAGSAETTANPVETPVKPAAEKSGKPADNPLEIVSPADSTKTTDGVKSSLNADNCKSSGTAGEGEATETKVLDVENPAAVKEDEGTKAEEKREGRMSLKELAAEGGGKVPENLSTKYSFTNENINEQLTCTELSKFLGFSRGQASTLYSMAGKKGKRATMSAREFIHYMTHTVVNNKFLRKFISDDQVDGLFLIEAQMDSVMMIPPAAEPADDVARTQLVAEAVEQAIDKAEVVKETAAAKTAVEDVAVSAVESVSEDLPDSAEPEDPMAVLAEFAASGRKVSSKELSLMLDKAGIELEEGMTDLLYMYFGSRRMFDRKQKLSIEELVAFLSEEVAHNPLYAPFIGEEQRTALAGLKDRMNEGMGSLKSDRWSMAAVVTEHELESKEVFDFVGSVSQECKDALGDDCYIIGESVMYKEMSDGFRHELLILTLLTVISIFLIVAVTFKSLLIPTILVLTVMSGVYVNVFVSGIGGRTMLYLAYLIVQSILMGATIDYGILFTNYYLEKRGSSLAVADALREAYRGSIHTIMTSGLIIVFAPYIMSLLLPDPAISSILSSLTFGALAAILLILFVLPATLAVCDKVITRKIIK